MYESFVVIILKPICSIAFLIASKDRFHSINFISGGRISFKYNVMSLFFD
jgi:hypothetical protein